MKKLTKTLLSFLLPVTLIAGGCSDDEIEYRAFSDCPDLAGHWIGDVDSGDKVEIWVYQSDGNIKIAVMFFDSETEELTNIAYYNLYPDGSAKFESEGPVNEETSEMKVLCKDDQLWLLENRTIKIGDLEFSLEMIGYFFREGDFMYLKSVNNSLPSGDGKAKQI